MESLPRTEQSRGILPERAGPPPPSHPVKRETSPSTSRSDIAKLRSYQTPKPTSKPASKPSTPPKTESRSIASTPKPPLPSKTKDRTDVLEPLLIDPTPDPEPAKPASMVAKKDTKAEKPKDKPSEAVTPPTPAVAPPQAEEFPVVAGDSIFRRLAEMAAAAALRESGEHLEYVAGPAPPAKTETIPVKAVTRTPPTPPLSATPKAPEKAVAKVDKPQPKRGTPGELGLSVDEVLDLTADENDLPFVEHKPPSKDSGAGTGDMVISAINQTEFDIDSSQMEFSGNVQVKSPRFALRCDRFVVHLKADGSGMAYGEAIGNVYIRMLQKGKPTGHEGFAHKAIYRPDEGKLTLAGWPKIREEHKEHVAATASTQMVLYTDGRVKTLGRNRTVIRN